MKDQPKSESKEEDKIFIDGDFNNSYEARVKKATGKNMILSKEEYNKMQEEITRLKAELERERELRKEIVRLVHKYQYDTKVSLISEIQSLIERQKTYDR